MSIPNETEASIAALESVAPQPLRESSLRSKMRWGVAAWGMANVAARASKAVVYLILIWLLAASDFGLAIMTVALMAIPLTLSEFGVGVAVIQKKDLSDAYASSAFWLNLTASLAMAAAMWPAAPWLAQFCGANEMTALVRVAALGMPVQALRTIPTALLRKRMQFGLYSGLETIWHVLSGALAVVFALLGAGYWSLLVPSIVAGLVMAPVYFMAARWRPSFSFDGKVLREVFDYTKNVVGATLLGLLLHNAGYIIAGHVTDTHWAGLYNVAATNAMFVVINYACLIGNVSLSGFAVKQGEPETLRYAFGRVFEILAATTLPVHLLGIALAPLIFAALLPATYLPSIAAFQVLLGFAAVRALAGHVAPFFNAIDRSDINLKFYVASTPLCLAVMYGACRYAKTSGGDDAAILALAWATALSQGVSVLAWLALVPRTLAWKRAGLIPALAPYGVSAAVAVAVAKGASLGLDALHAPALLNLAACTALGGFVYLFALYAGARPSLARLVCDIVPVRVRERYVYALLPSLELKRNASAAAKP